jgi:hypothetical protein
VANDDTVILKSMTAWSFAAPGVLANDTDADGDPLTAALDSDAGVTPPAAVTLNADGSFDYTADPADWTLGTVSTFTYVANDGTDDSAPATVTLHRELAVSQAVCQLLDNNQCDWTIIGKKSNTSRVTVEAYAGGFETGTLIGRVRALGEDWTIEPATSRATPDVDGTVDVRIRGDADAEILDFPVTVQ